MVPRNETHVVASTCSHAFSHRSETLPVWLGCCGWVVAIVTGVPEQVPALLSVTHTCQQRQGFHVATV
eukprot:3366441-Amphidinium_carterae.1